MPEFPDLDISGWKGSVMETSGSGSEAKIILEWDSSVVDQMAASYRQHCESQGLMFTMACLPAKDVHVSEQE